MRSTSDSEDTILAPHDVMRLQMAEAYQDADELTFQSGNSATGTVQGPSRTGTDRTSGKMTGRTDATDGLQSNHTKNGLIDMSDIPDMSVGWYASPQEE